MLYKASAILTRFVASVAVAVLIQAPTANVRAEALTDSVLYANAQQAADQGKWSDVALYLFAYIQRDPIALQADANHRGQVNNALAMSRAEIDTAFANAAKLSRVSAQLRSCQGGVGAQVSSLSTPPPKLSDAPSVSVPREMSFPMWGNVDVPGLDYANFDMTESDPTQCQSACLADARCKAWTYVKPNTIQGPNPRCWLKNAMPKAVTNTCCISGRR